MALSDLVDMALVREAVGSITESLEDPELLDQIRLGEIVPSRKQLEELAKISAGAAVPLRNLIEELSRSGAAQARKVPWDDLVRIAGDAEAADEWLKGEQWPDTRQSHEKLIAAAVRSNGVAVTTNVSVVDVVPITASAHADLFARIDNVIAALAEVRSRADQTLKQIAPFTRSSASEQQAGGVPGAASLYEPPIDQLSLDEKSGVPDLSDEDSCEIYELEWVMRNARVDNTLASTRNVLCVECGRAWNEPLTRSSPCSFLCELCNEGTFPASINYNYLNLWD
jgi:hypothetical protein